MSQLDNIANLIEIEDINVKKVEHTDTQVLLYFELDKRPHECPRCKNVTQYVCDYRMQKVKDLPVAGKNLIWMYRKRRYVCKSCRKKFYEKQGLLPKRHRITNRTALYALQTLSAGRGSQKDVARMLGVSPSSVCRWMGNISMAGMKKLPRVLGIDEFKGDTDGEKYQVILTDPSKHKVLDILSTRKETALEEYFLKFKNRDKVEYFVMDMYKPYYRIAKSLFPKATIVIDRFHMVRYGLWALENVRKKVQKKLTPELRKYFKKSRSLLCKRMRALSDEDKLKVNVMMGYSDELATAYLLKEYFFDFVDSKDRDEARKYLRIFLMQCQMLQLKEFKHVVTMLNNWQSEILNSFECEYNNGFTEGTNNSIKVIKRTAFGYRTFENLRKRILMVHTA